MFKSGDLLYLKKLTKFWDLNSLILFGDLYPGDLFSPYKFIEIY